jgi:hypothetical protein
MLTGGARPLTRAEQRENPLLTLPSPAVRL